MGGGGHSPARFLGNVPPTTQAPAGSLVSPLWLAVFHVFRVKTKQIFQDKKIHRVYVYLEPGKGGGETDPEGSRDHLLQVPLNWLMGPAAPSSSTWNFMRLFYKQKQRNPEESAQLSHLRKLYFKGEIAYIYHCIWCYSTARQQEKNHTNMTVKTPTPCGQFKIKVSVSLRVWGSN